MPDQNMLKGKAALVTGGVRGIGLAIAEAFAAQGADIAINYIVGGGEELVNKIQAHGVRCKLYYGDVGDFAQTKQNVDDVMRDFGRIDILVNNAGITRDTLMLRMSERDFDDVIRINLKGAFNMIKHVSPFMLKRRAGAIINLASVVGLSGNIGQANYAASKAGIIGLTKAAAKEFASRNITCNAIAPGFIQTLMTASLDENVKKAMLENIPLRRFGEAEDVARAALFLATSPYVTGQVISVDGGMHV